MVEKCDTLSLVLSTPPILKNVGLLSLYADLSDRTVGMRPAASATANRTPATRAAAIAPDGWMVGMWVWVWATVVSTDALGVFVCGVRIYFRISGT